MHTVINRWQCRADTDITIVAEVHGDPESGHAVDTLTAVPDRGDCIELWRAYLPPRTTEQTAYLSCLGSLCSAGHHIAMLKHDYQLRIHLRNGKKRKNSI